MRRAAPVAVLALVVGAAAVLFWAASPSVPERPDPSVDGGPNGPASARTAGRVGAADEDLAGEEGRLREEGEDAWEGGPEGEGGVRTPKSQDPERGAIRRLRRQVDAMIELEVPTVEPGLSVMEEDAAIAGPIAERAKRLKRISDEVKRLEGLDSPARAARANQLLAEAHEHMAGFFVERPVPSYLDADGRDRYLDALDDRAAEQEEQAAAARAHAADLSP